MTAPDLFRFSPRLGQIPKYWGEERLRWLIHNITQGWSPEAEDREPTENEWGVLKLNAVQRGTFNAAAVKTLPPGLEAPYSLQIQPGDVLVTRANTPGQVGDVCFVPEVRPRVILSDLIYQLRLDSGRINGRFLSYFLLSSAGRLQIESDARGTSNSMVKISQDHIKDWWIPLPPLPRQQRIADFLDRETARLDELVAAKERVLGLLAEKRRAIITRAVTRGLDPCAPLRYSGNPWLGEIPAHWVATRLKFVAEVRGGLTLGKRYSTIDLVELPYLRVANVQDGYLDLSDVAVAMVPPAEAATCLLEPGDVLMNEGGDADKLGRGCVWRGEIAPCLHQNHVFAVRPRSVLSDWLSTWTSAGRAKDFFESRSKQSTNLASISATNLSELPIPLPPLDEQASIINQLSSELRAIAEIRSASERTVALLKERRAALITAAVTGQLEDVT